MKKQYIYLFLERNLGHGYVKAYPNFSTFFLRFYLFIIGKPVHALTKRFGYLIYYKSEIDENCPDPRSKGRSPRIQMYAVFPRGFDVAHLYSKIGNDLLGECWDTVMQIKHKGANSNLAIEIPTSWYK